MGFIVRAGGLAVALTSAVSCIEPAPRVCEGSEECRLEGVEGRCVEEACAYADDDCPSGERFGPFAGEKAGECTTPAIDCEGDACMDVSPMAGVELGIGVWDVAGSDEHGVAIARLDATTWIVIGRRGDAEPSPFVAAIDEAGAVRWQDEAFAMEGGEARGVAVGQEVVVVGDLAASDGRGTRAFTRAYALDGALRWSGVRDLEGDDVARDVALVSGGVAVSVGVVGGTPWIEGRDAMGETAWSLVPEGEAAIDLFAAALRSDAAVLVAGRDAASALWLRTYGGDGIAIGPAVRGPAIDAVRDVAVTPTGEAVVAGTSGGRAWVAVIGLDGTARWERRPFDGEAHAVVTTAEGDVVAAGDRTDGTAFLARWTAAGEPVWTAIVDEPGTAHEARDVALGDAEILLLGSSLGDRGDRDVWVRRYAP